MLAGIMTRGFELDHDGRGNLHGRGVYIARTYITGIAAQETDINKRP